jgi:hypothetical protein
VQHGIVQTGHLRGLANRVRCFDLTRLEGLANCRRKSCRKRRATGSGYPVMLMRMRMRMGAGAGVLVLRILTAQIVLDPLQEIPQYLVLANPIVFMIGASKKGAQFMLAESEVHEFHEI